MLSGQLSVLRTFHAWNVGSTLVASDRLVGVGPGHILDIPKHVIFANARNLMKLSGG